MLIYFLLFPIIILLYIFTNNGLLKSKKIFIGLSFSILGIISSIRSPQVGTDTSTYQTLFFYQIHGIKIFNSNNPELSSKAPLYGVYSRIVSMISVNLQTITIANSLLIAFLFGIFIYRLKINPLYSTLLFISIGFFTSSLNTSRQFIAIGLVCNALLFLFDKKAFIYFALITVAISIHTLAIVGLIFYPIYKIKWTAVKISCFLIVLTMTSFFLESVSKIFIQFFPNYAFYLQNPVTFFGASSRIIMILDIGLILIILLFYALTKYYHIKCSQEEVSLLIIFLIGPYFEILVFHNQSILLLTQRFLTFFSILSIAVIPGMCAKVSKKFNNPENVSFAFFSVIFIFTLFTFSVEIQKYWGVIPYITFM